MSDFEEARKLIWNAETVLRSKPERDSFDIKILNQMNAFNAKFGSPYQPFVRAYGQLRPEDGVSISTGPILMKLAETACENAIETLKSSIRNWEVDENCQCCDNNKAILDALKAVVRG